MAGIIQCLESLNGLKGQRKGEFVVLVWAATFIFSCPQTSTPLCLCSDWLSSLALFAVSSLQKANHEASSLHKYTSFSSVQSLSRVRLFAISWTAAHQASLSITNSQSWFKLMSTESVMPSNHLILSSCLQFCPPSGSFPMSRLFASGGQSIGASASASILPMNIQEWFHWLDLSSCSPSDSQESSL